MTELKPINLRDANQHFSKIIRQLEEGEEGYVVLKHGKPVARILPVPNEPKNSLTPDQEAALARILSTKFNRSYGRFDRDELYDDRFKK